MFWYTTLGLFVGSTGSLPLSQLACTACKRRFNKMASDGCDEVAWKGQSFPYLMHRPDNRAHNYGEVRAEQGAPKFAQRASQTLYGCRVQSHIVALRICKHPVNSN
jgi:hypothetical protein